MGQTYVTNINNPVVKKVLNDIHEDISTSLSNVCGAVSNNVQTIQFRGIKLKGCKANYENIFNGMTSSVSANCIQSTEFKNMLQDKVIDHLNKLRSIGHTETADQIDNIIKTNVNVSKLSSCMATSFNNQTILFEDIEIENCPPEGVNFRNIGNVMASTFMVKCLQADSPGLIEAFNKIEPLDPIAPPPSLFDNIFGNGKSSEEFRKGVIIATSIGAVTLFLLICFLVFYFTRTPTTS